ncbi:MAG: fimbrillin family protein [Rikenellaceae bacterium]|nr:fimbrillin family protein [Rikenellaceae bacterium]
MKKIFMTLAASALVLGGCTDGDVDSTIEKNEMVTVRFAASSADIQVRSTRAGQNYTGVIGINPESDGTWEVAPTAETLKFESALSNTENALAISGTAVADNAVQIKSTGANNAKFVSFGVASGDVAISGNTVTLNANGDGTELTNDYIYASTEQPVNAVNGNAAVSFAYSHVMAKLRVELYEKDYSNAKITEGVTISGVDQLGIVRNGSLDITTGVVTPSTTALPSSIALNTEYFVLPQTAGAGKTFTVNFNGKDYTVDLGASGLELTANKIRVIRLLVTGSGITFKATLEDWTEENTDINISL